MIRTMTDGDLAQVAQLWLDGNADAHDFIPLRYWTDALPMVQTQLLQAEVYVYEHGGALLGFAGLQGTHIAGLFVSRAERSKGIGRQLLDHIKGCHAALTLCVYQKNPRAFQFYLREGFRAGAARIDPETGEWEYPMSWAADTPLPRG